MTGFTFRWIRLAAAMALGAFQTGSVLARPDDLIQVIAFGLGPDRAVEGRLANISSHQPFNGSTVLLQRSIRDLSSDALAAYSAVRQQLAARRAPHILQIAGEAELLLGRTTAAIALLHECLADTRCPTDTWSDLAAAYLRQADEDGPDTSAQLTARAIDAASQVTSVAPGRPHGWFNLGLGLTRMHLDKAASEAWTRFLGLEPSETWRKEVYERQAKPGDSAAARWSKIKTGLLTNQALSPTDLIEITTSFAQQGRDVVLEELLPLWGRAWLAGRWDEADARRQRAAELVQELERVDGDRLLTDCVTRIQATSQGRQSQVGRDLAAAHVAYGDARQLFEANRREESARKFSEAAAAFVSGRSPCRIWAEVGLGGSEYQAGRLASARSRLGSVTGIAKSRGYSSILGRAQWTAGAVLVRMSEIESALDSFEESLAVYERSHEVENSAAVAGVAAHELHVIGEYAGGWRFLGAALRQLDWVVSARRRYVLLFNASWLSADSDLPWTSLVFQRAALDAAYERGVANTIVEALIQQARRHLQVGNITEAAANLKEASRHLPTIPSPDSLEYQRAWLARVNAELNIHSNPTETLRLIDDALVSYFTNREPDQVPVLLLARGRAALNAQDHNVAEASFRRGLEVFQTQWRGLTSPEHRVSYADESWDLFDELIRLRVVDQADRTGGLEYAETARGQHGGVIATSTDKKDLLAGWAVEMSDSELLYYVSLNDQLLAWRLGSDGVHFANLKIARAELAQLVGAYREALQTAESALEVRTIGAGLYGRLIQPVLPNRAAIHKLVVIPDGALYAMPFGSLVEPLSGRFLFQDRDVVVSPSLTHFLRARDRFELLSRQQTARILLVGGAINSDPSLATLPGAIDELSDVGANYRKPDVLSGLRATPAEFSRAAKDADIIHFAGHAKSNLAFPWSSALVLTPDVNHMSGLLTVREISTWNLPNTRLVVLGACQTAYGPLYRGEGLISLARPFLDVGVPSVIGAMWDIDDRVARRFLVDFHREYTLTGDPSHALVTAQRALIDSPDPTLSLPRNWSAFSLFGASGTRAPGK
jgi:CHAT domain-containing protein